MLINGDSTLYGGKGWNLKNVSKVYGLISMIVGKRFVNYLLPTHRPHVPGYSNKKL
jgi:hypothetical protein